MSMSINPVDLAAAAEGILNTQYLLQRERLLSASAQASRLLLEAPDAMKAMPEVLRLLGEAAQVDRTALAFAEIGPNGEKWLKIQAEWVTESLADTCTLGRLRRHRPVERAALGPVLHHAAWPARASCSARIPRAPSKA